LVLIARCVGGQRVLMWVFATELGEIGAGLRASASTPCAKVKLLETAVSLRWTPEQVATVAKSLGLK